MKFTVDTNSKKQTITGSNMLNELYQENELVEPPLITYYAKVIDNLTNQDITNYKNAMDNDFTWYYGTCNVNGGESQYIVQFDIWNNEPAFNHRFYDKHCKDAYNVKFSIKINNKDYNDESYMQLMNNDFIQARILMDNYSTEWNYIGKGIKLVGNVKPENKKLLGVGDHCILQTKIVISDNMNIDMNRYYFESILSYEYK